MKAFEIVDWDRNFENSRSREITRLSSVSIPNSHDGQAYGELMAQEDADRLFACWIWIVQVASKCKRRGLLIRDNGKPHTPESLAAKTRAKPEWFRRAIPFLERLGWLRRTAVDRQLIGSLSAVPTQCQNGADALPTRCRRSAEEDIGGGETRDSVSVSGGRARAGKAQRAARLRKAEPPAGTPPPREAVLEMAKAEGIAEDAAIAFCDHFESVGWLDARGRPLRSWRARLRVWWRDWQRRGRQHDKPPGTPGKAPPGSLTASPPASPPKPLGELLAERPELREQMKNVLASMRAAVAGAPTETT